MTTNKIDKRAHEIGLRRLSTTIIGARDSIAGKQPLIDNTVTYRMWLLGTSATAFTLPTKIDDLFEHVDKIILRLAEEEIAFEESQKSKPN